MYLFTYAYDDDDTNELYSEYHLGRQAFRICKKGTKYCAWHREMPDFKQWRSSCVTYDHFRDSYKLYIDGVQVESGTWAGDNAPEPIRPGGVFIIGQDQDKLRGEYNPRQSWSGSLTQMNLWDFSIEKWDIENIAECRSDVFGNVVKVRQYVAHFLPVKYMNSSVGGINVDIWKCYQEAHAGLFSVRC